MNLKKLRLALIFSLGLLAIAACNYPSPTPARVVQVTITFPTASGVQVGAPEEATPTPFQPVQPTNAIIPSVTPQPPTPTATVSPWEDLRSYETPLPKLSGEEHVNILLIGSDRRSGGSFRTDTMILVSIRPKDKTVSLISIPRDLYVYIPGWTTNRINTAFNHGVLTNYPGGGPGQLKDTILFNLGIEVDYYAMVEFNGFQDVIDTLGGVDIPMVCSFTEWHVIDPNRSLEYENNWALYTVGPGMVYFDGDLALWYARARMRSSDFDRGRRQQEVIRAIYQRGLQLNIIPQIPSLYREFKETVETDMSLTDILALAPLALDIQAANIRSFYINRDVVMGWTTPEGGSVLLPKTKELKALVEEALGPPDKDEDQHLNTVIEVLNWSGNVGWGELAVERLNYAGYPSVVGESVQEDAKKTLLYSLSPDNKKKDDEALLALLGLNSDQLREGSSVSAALNYQLVIGQDYNPCFDPAKIDR